MLHKITNHIINILIPQIVFIRIVLIEGGAVDPGLLGNIFYRHIQKSIFHQTAQKAAPDILLGLNDPQIRVPHALIHSPSADLLSFKCCTILQLFVPLNFNKYYKKINTFLRKC